MNKLKLGLLLSFQMLLSGCGSSQCIAPIVTTEVPTPANIPKELTQVRCDPPPYNSDQIVDNTDNESYVSKLLDALSTCDMKWQKLDQYLQLQEQHHE